MEDHRKWYPAGWYYDEQQKKWIEPEYQAEHGERSPTGWIYDRDTLKWTPPKSLQRESSKRWKWDAEKQIWIDKEKETRLRKYREYHKDKPPTFEEWKAAKEKELEKSKKG